MKIVTTTKVPIDKNGEPNFLMGYDVRQYFDDDGNEIKPEDFCKDEVWKKGEIQMTLGEIRAYEQGYSDGFKKAMTHYLDVTQEVVEAHDRIGRILLDHNKLIMKEMDANEQS